MSRRAKYLLLTPLFLLVGVLVVYFFATWHPRDPLRFRVVDVPLPSMGRYHEDSQITVAVENVTSRPIYLRHVSLPNPTWAPGLRRASGAIVPREQMEHVVGAQQEYLLVPAYGTIHTAALVMNEYLEDARAGKLDAEYKWMSSKKYACASLIQRIKHRMPSAATRLLPEPSHGIDQGRLEALAP